MSNNPLSACVDGLPNICGSAALIAQAMSGSGPVYLPESDLDFSRARSAFAIALHMHQPLISAGGGDPQTARIICNLQYMMEHPEMKDAHNAAVFISCYRRMGQIIPELVGRGLRPRVRGFSFAEMALPNHPDLCYEFVRTLKECG